MIQYRIKITNHEYWSYMAQIKRFWLWNNLGAGHTEADAQAIIRDQIRDEEGRELKKQKLQALKPGSTIPITQEDLLAWKLQGKL
jgi:hypothetical protein